MARKLYSFIPDVELPVIAGPNIGTGEALSQKETIPGFFSITWPNGTPCVLVEMFLLDKSNEVKISKTDGGTIKNYASHLTHLIRYCYTNKLEFWNLTSLHFDEFSLTLVNEVDENNVRKRSNNTIRSIIASCVTFLDWLQNNIVRDKNIIGVDENKIRYQIKLKRGSHTTNKGKIIKYTYFPTQIPISSVREKSPISSNTIKQLWDTLSEIKTKSHVNRRLTHYFTQQEQKEHLEYMHKRRELQLALLEATGLRPQELTKIGVSNNIPYLEKDQIQIPTLKTREGNGRTSQRVIPISPALSIRISVFIQKNRKLLLSRLSKYGFIKSEEDADDIIYLNPETGRSVKPDAAYQEFSRLTKKAGIKQKNCQSMFRHRFITNMVKLHLMSFMDKNPLKSRHLITESDYRTILHKVSGFTGHKSTTSLFYYIDLAWEELDVFEYAYDIKELQDRIIGITQIIHSLRSDIHIGNLSSYTKIKQIVDDALNEMENLTNLYTNTK